MACIQNGNCIKCGKPTTYDIYSNNGMCICNECYIKEKDLAWEKYFEENLSGHSLEYRIQKIERWIFEGKYITERIEDMRF